MTLLHIWVQTPTASALGWTLLHSLWQGAAAALALAVAFCVIRSSRVRYAAACLAMAGMMTGFVVTFAWLASQRPVRRSPVAWSEARPISEGLGFPRGMQQNRNLAGFLPWLAPFWIAGVAAFQMRSLTSWLAVRRMRRTGVCCAPAAWQERLDRLGARVRLAGSGHAAGIVSGRSSRRDGTLAARDPDARGHAGGDASGAGRSHSAA